MADIISKKTFPNEYTKAIANVMYTNNWLDEKRASDLRKYNITKEQYNVLRILRGQFPNPSSIALITDRMLNKLSNASRLVDKLEASAYVIRTASVDDKRKVDVLITNLGLEVLKELDVVSPNWIANLYKLDEKEVSDLSELLDKFRNSID